MSGKPSQELLIKDGHPLLIEGEETTPEVLIEQGLASRECLAESEHIYTLITQYRTFAEISGIGVGTWSAVAWSNFVERDPKGKSLSWHYVH